MVIFHSYVSLPEGIYANMTGVYWWDPWHTIYSSTMDPSWDMNDRSLVWYPTAKKALCCWWKINMFNDVTKGWIVKSPYYDIYILYIYILSLSHWYQSLFRSDHSLCFFVTRSESPPSLFGPPTASIIGSKKASSLGTTLRATQPGLDNEVLRDGRPWS